MPYNYLPGIPKDEQDGNLQIAPVSGDPITLVIGTAAQGDSETLYTVARVSDAASEFGKTGTLTRGMYEASIAGAKNIRLFRIGATSATLSGVGAGTGLTIETVLKDDSMGTDYTIFFDASLERLYVYRASDSEVVYDNNPAYPLAKIDLGEVVVTGSTTGSATDIGSSGTPLTLAAADGEGDGPAVYAAGTDGVNLSRMKLYEALYDAYELLGDQDIDLVIPMNVYLDDLNVMDLTPAQISTRSLTSLTTYPTASDTDDVLGKLYVEEYEGVNYFWWWFPTDPTAATAAQDIDVATGVQIYPTITGLSNLDTKKTDGTALTSSDFHEVNFAYQLATFCYTQSRDNNDMTGTIGVLPPDSFGLKDVALWVGKLPTTETDTSGNTVIASGGNGTGLLGNKFMSGRIGVTSSLTPYTVNSVAGLYNGGFIGTDDGWLDGTELTDNNDHLVDIGKYISVVATYPILSNSSQTTAYTATGAPTYGGFYSNLSPVSAPTNKVLKSVRLPFRVSLAKLDLLAGQRYVTFHAKTRGIVVSDAPTAARPDSDYQRLSTVRQVKAAMDSVRTAADPFLGEGMTGALIAALDTAIDGALKSLVKQGLIVRYEHQLSATPQQRVVGQATCELKLVPAFELRQITVVVALAAT